MTEERFVGQMCMDKLLVHFEDRDSEQNIPPIATIKDMEIVDLLNKQDKENQLLRKEINELYKLCDESGVMYHIGDELEEVLDDD